MGRVGEWGGCSESERRCAGKTSAHRFYLNIGSIQGSVRAVCSKELSMSSKLSDGLHRSKKMSAKEAIQQDPGRM